MKLTQSKKTGLTVCDYVRAACAGYPEQKQFAILLGVPKQTLNMWMCGHCEPKTVGKLLALEAVTGVPLESFLPEVVNGVWAFENVVGDHLFSLWSLRNHYHIHMPEHRNKNNIYEAPPRQLAKLSDSFEAFRKFRNPDWGAAIKAYKWAIGPFMPYVFDLKRTSRTTWTFGTECYSFVIDIAERKIIGTYRETQKVSIERDFPNYI